MSECHYKGYAYSTVDDHSRVILKGKHPEQDTDYINASYIDVSALSLPFFLLILLTASVLSCLMM